ncbi:MAG: transporter substrate-binding domain-containing protein [Proteobacteria bacterium]|nr:transporter substrate-binding domain-containing protein [Pseudomonadota bacterium]
MLLAVFAALAASIPAFAQTTSETPDLPRRVAVRFMTDSDYPPFDYYDEEGVLTGFNVDIARAICLELSAACDIQVRNWSELLPALKRGDTDALVASHAITPQLLKDFDVSDRYYFTPARFVGRRDGREIVATPEGLEGRRIGVVKGSAHEAYLKTFFHNSAIVPFESVELARDALRTNDGIDATFGDGISLAFWINGTLSRACCEFKGGPYYEPKYFGDGVGVVLSKKDPQLKGLINSALAKLRASGRYEELLLRYFPNRVF